MYKLFILLFCILFSPLWASIGKVGALNGDVYVQRETSNLKAYPGFEVEQRDTITTGLNAKAQILFSDGTVVTVGKNAQLIVAEYVFDEQNPNNSKTSLNFAEGTFKTITGKIGKVAPSKFKLATKSASIGIRGTIIVGDQTAIACIQGEIIVSAQGITQTVPKGMMVQTLEGLPPSQPQPYEPGSVGDLDDSGIQQQTTNENTNQDETNNETQQTPEEQNENNDNDTTTQNTPLEEEIPLETPQENADTPTNTEITQLNQDITVQNQTQNQDEVKTEVESLIQSDTASTPTATPTTSSSSSSSSQSDTTVTKTLSGAKGYFFQPDGQQGGDSTYSMSSYSSFTYPSNKTVTLKKDNSLKLLTDGSTWSFEFSTPASSYSSYTTLSSSGFEYGINTIEPTIYADNKMEFFVIKKTINATEQGTLNDLIFLGTAPTMSNLESNRIYKYKDVAVLTYDNDLNTEVDEIYTYINSTTKSLEEFEPNEQPNSQSNFSVDKLNNDGTISSKEYTLHDDYYTHGGKKITSSSITAQLYGSALQGFGWRVEENYTQDDSPSSFKEIGAAYLNSKDTATQTGTANFSGYALTSNMEDVVYDMTIGVNRGTGYITSNIVDGSQKIAGSVANIANLASYYVSDDMFGAVFNSTANTSYASKTLISEKGWFYTIADYVDNDSVYSMDQSDESAWGYWAASFSDVDGTAFINPSSVWVAGIKTPENIVTNNYINQNITANFSGHVLGNMNNSSIPFNSSNSFTATLHFGSGGGSFTANMSFNGNSEVQFSGSLTTSGFTGSLMNDGQLNGQSVTSASLQGKYYGASEIKSIGGSFKIESANNKAQGVFKAKKD